MGRIKFERTQAFFHNTAAIPYELKKAGLVSSTKIVPIDPPIKDEGNWDIRNLSPKMNRNWIRQRLTDAGFSAGDLSDLDKLSTIQSNAKSPSQMTRWSTGKPYVYSSAPTFTIEALASFLNMTVF